MSLKSPLSTVNSRKRSSEVKESSLKKFKENVSHEITFDYTSQSVLMNNDEKMPIIQFGTYKMKGDECYRATLSALKNGYKGLDTASVYDNEKEVGQAIRDSGIEKKSIFIQTKLWRSFVGPNKSGKPKCDSELRKSLKKLGVSRINVWLMHWPGPGRHLNYPPVRMGMERPKKIIDGNQEKMVPLDWTPQMRLDTYQEMAKFVKSGEVGALGVCNFSVRQLRDLVDFCQANSLPLPAVVQNECHPLLQANEVREFCQQHGIVFQAYASLGAGSLGLVENPTLVTIAQSHGVSTAQVLLRWGLQNKCTLLPKSCKSERQKSNLDIWNFKLSQQDMMSLGKLETASNSQNTMAGWLREHDPDFY